MAYGKDLTLQISLFFLVLNRPFFLESTSKSSLKENTASLSQVGLHYSFKSIIWKHVWVVTLWLSGIYEILLCLKKHYIYNWQHATLCLETVNSALLPLRWSNSRHSTCHSSWQAVYLENSILVPSICVAPQAFQRQTANTANLNQDTKNTMLIFPLY